VAFWYKTSRFHGIAKRPRPGNRDHSADIVTEEIVTMLHDAAIHISAPPRVIVAHTTALLCAGLAAILASRGDWDVRTWDGVDERMPSPPTPCTPILVGDAPMILRLSRNVRGARVVLLASEDSVMDEDAPADETLPPECRADELIGAVDRLCAPVGAPVRPAGPQRGGLAPGALRRVREYRSVRLAERIEISDLAAVAGLSACHFARAFRESVGVPPHRYVTDLRLSTAATLVRETDHPLTQIAQDVGFFDLSHFSRLFGRTFGEPPRTYRCRYR
jgi:AraC-like DNA-binding protein